MSRMAVRFLVGLGLTLMGGATSAQTLGTFSWQLQPYCNRLTLTVTQQGSQYQLDGTDLDCGGTPSAARGMALVLQDGTVRLGVSLVSATSAAPVTIDAIIALPSYNGTWRDSAGNTGTLILGANTGGANRPVITLTGARPGTANVVIGPGSLVAPTSGSYNTGLGNRVLAAITTGSNNTATGSFALTANTVGSRNTAAGSYALADNTTGTANTATGYYALSYNTTGGENTATGHAALSDNTTGGSNTATGNYALADNTTGSNNSAAGESALSRNISGSYNTAVGSYALDANTTGSSNTAVGRDALSYNVTGGSNTAVGWLSGPASGSTNLNNTTAIGTGATVTASDMVAIGNASVTRTVIQGIRGRTTGNANAVAVVIDSAGQLGTVSSSARTKDNIAPLPPEMSQRVLALRPVQFTYKVPFADGTQPVQYGLIAEEVEQVMPELVAYNDAGEVETVTYHVLPALLLNEVQRLERERAAQTAQLHAQAVQLAAQSAQLASQAADLSELRALVDSLARQLAQQR